MIICPPNHKMARMQPYTTSCMIGIMAMMMRSAAMEEFISSSLDFLNFSFS